MSKVVAALLILLMVIGSLLLWIAIPIGWLLLASRLTDSSQPSLGPYMVVIIGIPVSMILVGKLLTKLNGVYGQVTGKAATVHVQLPWHKSMRGERDTGRPRSVLDVVMVCSVGAAGLVFLVWFLFFAQAKLPGG